MAVTYIVSGYMRSGTSCMMDALSAGGLTPVFNKGRNKMNILYGDQYYVPNPRGFYELRRKDYLEQGFPRKYEGKLIKCLYGAILRIVAGDYKIVFMMRDPEEIRQSYEAFFGSKPPIIDNYYETMSDTIGVLQQRRDVDLTVLNYRDVVENPQREFRKLQHWGFDVNKAISVINPSMLRFRKEVLTVGI